MWVISSTASPVTTSSLETSRDGAERTQHRDLGGADFVDAERWVQSVAGDHHVLPHVHGDGGGQVGLRYPAALLVGLDRLSCLKIRGYNYNTKLEMNVIMDRKAANVSYR